MRRPLYFSFYFTQCRISFYLMQCRKCKKRFRYNRNRFFLA
ncbi:hypothetical protein HMPREF9554_02993 [Treponema phagedenis F0421]|nr:hypothetical protein HMPREF9554_02993 [Treponema phagedenis F0421]